MPIIELRYFDVGLAHLCKIVCRELSATGTAWCSTRELLFHCGEVVARTQTCLQKERRTTATQFPLRDDGDSVAQEISLIHIVCRQNDCTIWKWHGAFTSICMCTLSMNGLEPSSSLKCLFIKYAFLLCLFAIISHVKKTCFYPLVFDMYGQNMCIPEKKAII